MATDKYTPTDEDIRECWEEAWQAGDRPEQFTRWLAAHDAEAKAEALEEAAEHKQPNWSVSMVFPEFKQFTLSEDVRDWLRARAAKYRTPKETP